MLKVNLANKRDSRFRSSTWLVLLLALASPVAAQAPNKRCEVAAEPTCNGFLYRPKRDGVPVYDVPDETGTVLRKLQLGERVCYVGERGGFAILDWSNETPKPRSTEGEESNLAFAKNYLLWPPRGKPTGNRSMFTRVKTYVRYLLNGGVPDTPVLPIGSPVPSDGNTTSSSTETVDCEPSTAP